MKNPINFIRANVLLIIILVIVIIGLTYSIILDSRMSSYHHNPMSLPDDTTSVEMVSVKVPMHKFKSTDLYKKNCKFCHGTYGKGDGIKAKVDSTLCPYDLSKEQKNDTLVYWAIAKGQNRMPEHQEKLSDANIDVLVIYIKRFRKK